MTADLLLTHFNQVFCPNDPVSYTHLVLSFLPTNWKLENRLILEELYLSFLVFIRTNR